MNLKDIKNEYALTCCGDSWGTAMQWFFTIADELYFEREITVPSEWEFRPSPLGPSNDDDDLTTQMVRGYDDETLVAFGNILNRYVRFLKRAGKYY